MSGDTKRYLKYLKAEREAGRIYRALAELTSGDPRDALLELAEIEDRHASHWADKLREAGAEVPEDDGGLDPAAVKLIERARRSSLQVILSDLEDAEREAQSVYDNEPDARPGMADDEHLHAQVLESLREGAGHGEASEPALLPTSTQGRTLDELREALNKAEPWHRTDKSGSLRAAVFGISDGLVSNTALVMGFAGSGIGGNTVMFAGIAGLLAGAFSMGAGEFVSVASQKDIFTREITLEAEELRDKPLEEQRELELIYRAKGLDKETAKIAAAKIMSDPDVALDTLAREELGLDPSELGSPIKVAASSFVAFAVGAVVPVIPYFFGSGTINFVISILLAVIALIAVGATVGHVSGAGTVKSAIRQLLVGSAAAAVTFIIGRLIGVNLG